MRIVVTGGRDFADREMVVSAMSALGVGDGDVIVDGCASGADTLCAEVASKLGAEIEPHPADWKKYGKAAGPLRNHEMIDSGCDFLLAFPGGRGTGECKAYAKRHGVRVIEAEEAVSHGI